VPLDFTARNHRAVRMAGRLAESFGAEVLLLHGIERIDDGRIAGLASFYARLEKSAREKMRPHLASLETRGVRASGEILYGRVVAEILDFASEREVDLIIVSSHTVGPQEGWSTTSYKVGILSRCPVLLVK
jgi:nucleotide-binding universal stress UspA family protein